MPTGWPALSLHCSAGFMLSRNSAVVPTIASELPHAVVIAFSRVVRGQLRVGGLHDDLAAREAAVGVDVLRPRLRRRRPSPGTGRDAAASRCRRSTVTVIVVGVTPTSVACSGVVLQTSEVVAVAARPWCRCAGVRHRSSSRRRTPLRPSTMTSRTPTQPKRLKVPPQLPAARRSDGPSDWKVRACPVLTCDASSCDHDHPIDVRPLTGRTRPIRAWPRPR